jgi:hypothetical protein
MFVDPAEEKKA